jgi:hypothetical protein
MSQTEEEFQKSKNLSAKKNYKKALNFLGA